MVALAGWVKSLCFDVGGSAVHPHHEHYTIYPDEVPISALCKVLTVRLADVSNARTQQELRSLKGCRAVAVAVAVCVREEPWGAGHRAMFKGHVSRDYLGDDHWPKLTMSIMPNNVVPYEMDGGWKTCLPHVFYISCAASREAGFTDAHLAIRVRVEGT